MPVTSENLVAWKAATMISSLNPPTANVGGALASTGSESNRITGGSIGEVHATMAAAISGGTRRQYAKFFVRNTSADALSEAKICLYSLDDSPAGPFTCSGQSDSSSDDNTHKLRFLGFKTDGTPLSVELICAGTSEVVTTDQFGVLTAVENRDVSTGALKPSAGNKTIRCGATIVGVLRSGYYSITSEIKIGLVATLNDSGTTADALTAPSGISFSKPRTLTAGLSFANGGVLTGGAAQGIWSEYSVAELRRPSSDLQCPLLIEGASY